jgi:hypothetical protein
MRSNAWVMIAMCAVLSASTAWAAQSTASRLHHHKRHVTLTAPKPTSKSLDRFQSSQPYAHPGDGDNDGLSRDTDDCNKGCIDGNPG